MIHSKAFIFALLIIQSILFVTISAKGNPNGAKECGKCIKDSDCSTDRCFKRKCTYNNNASIAKCFPVAKPSPSRDPKAKKSNECGPCNRNNDCNTDLCYNNKCLYTNSKSIYKCFPQNRKTECGVCKGNHECGPNLKCMSRKCVKGSVKNSSKCFKRQECARCWYNAQCAQGKCIQKKCTSGYRQSLKRCKISVPKPYPSPSPMPVKRLNNCYRCKRNFQCKSNHCVDGICEKYLKTKGCLKKECNACKWGSQCYSGKCMLNICTDGSYVSKKRCGKKDNCAYCSNNSECISNFCFKKRCYKDKRSIRKC